MLKKSSVEYFLHAQIYEVVNNNGMIEEIKCTDDEGTFTVKAKAFVDNVITENSNLLALCQQKARQSQSGAQGVTIRAYMGAQHNFFCRQQHSACFLQAKLLTHALLPRLQAFLPA